MTGISRYISYIPVAELAADRRIPLAEMQRLLARLHLRPHPQYGCSPAQWKKLDRYLYDHYGKAAHEALT